LDGAGLGSYLWYRVLVENPEKKITGRDEALMGEWILGGVDSIGSG
jgi:hypothetical protein